MSQLCVLVHSFDRYAHLWPGYHKAFKQNWNLLYPECFFGSDIETENKVDEPFKMIYSGPGEWSDRLRKLVMQLPYDYILYMQEDHYPLTKPPLSECWDLMDDYNLLRLQMSPVTRFYTLEGADIPLYFDPSSKYLVSHQPSIWKKSFLLDCLYPGETPWVNEYKGTLRWQADQQKRDFITNRIAIYPCNWYAHKCIKGVVQS